MTGLIRTLLIVSLLTALPVGGQDYLSSPPDPQKPAGENLKVPLGWEVRLDRPNPEAVIGSEPDGSDIFFVNMTPGWHITTGPAAIFYHPASVGRGAYRAEATIHLFDPGDRNEGYGLLIGGADLAGDGQHYLYFLVRNSGDFLVKLRRGGETEVIRDWTPHSAIVTYTDESESSVENDFAIEVGPEHIAFFVNGEQVGEIVRGELPTDGLVGLRINHGLNVHVSNLAVAESG